MRLEQQNQDAQLTQHRHPVRHTLAVRHLGPTHSPRPVSNRTRRQRRPPAPGNPGIRPALAATGTRRRQSCPGVGLFHIKG